MLENSIPVNLFWTGGWDSSFRLLQLLIIYKRKVQPFYIIDPGRNSTLMEIRAMSKIRDYVINNYPLESKLMFPTHFIHLDEIQNNASITKSYVVLKNQIPIGTQYEWLARFCKHAEIHNMEFSLELRVNNEENKIINLIGRDMEKLETDLGVVYRVNKCVKEKDIYYLFGNMVFPLFSFTKKQMFEFSILNGFSEILKHSWFCFTPIFKNYPCGKCNPCRSVVSEGLGWRLPIVSKICYYIWPTLRKIVGVFGLG